MNDSKNPSSEEDSEDYFGKKVTEYFNPDSLPKIHPRDSVPLDFKDAKVIDYNRFTDTGKAGSLK